MNRPPLQPVDNHSSWANPSVQRPAAASVAAIHAAAANGMGPDSGGSDQAPNSGSGRGIVIAATAPGEDHSGDVDGLQDETPGRSPQRYGLSREAPSRELIARESTPGGSDPLGEGLGLLAGIAIALLTLVVPLLSVVSDRAPNPAYRVDGTSSNGPGR